MAFRAVIFDLDGTLLDTLADIGNAANRVLAERGFPIHPLARYREFIGDGVARLIRRVLPAGNQDETTIQACAEAFRQEYERQWNAQTKPYAGVPDMLDALVARGLRLAVLSNKPDRFTQLCVRELLPNWSFDAVLGASEALPRKPDPASALEVARRLGVTPSECLYVGDSGVDMQTAQAARMFAVGVLWGFREATELTREGAQALIERPGQLLALLQERSAEPEKPPTETRLGRARRLPSPDSAPGSQPVIEVLLFDLGGVLVEFDGITPLLGLDGGRLSREEARRFWLLSPSVRRFETGRCTPDEFARGALAELGLEMPPESFLKQFLAWDRGPMEGALELLDALKPRFRLACLSNNNALHWARLRAETGLAERFDHCYLSHEIGLMKPDREAYDYVVRDLGVSPSHILFLDDNPECVEGAKSAGLIAHRARGVKEVRSVLSALGCGPRPPGR